MKLKKPRNKGFTLIELLVGMILIITSATAVVVLLASSFRISNKTTSLEEVRASGQNAINLLQRKIQFAGGFYGASNDSSFTAYDNVCPVTAQAYDFIRIRTSTGIIQEVSCTPTTPIRLYFDDGNGAADLIDLNKVNITSCQLTCSQNNSTVPPVITLNLTVALKSTNSLPEKNATLSFSTSAKMRNL